MATERFAASRWTHGNRLFPTVIEVTETSVIRRKRSWFSRHEMSIHLQRVASVDIQTGLVWSEIRIVSTGGSEDLVSHGHTKADARRIKELIEAAQSRHLAAPGEEAPGEMKACPHCAEPIRAAAKVCRYCGRDV